MQRPILANGMGPVTWPERMLTSGPSSYLSVWRNAEWWEEQNRAVIYNSLRPVRARAEHFTRWEIEVLQVSGRAEMRSPE